MRLLKKSVPRYAAQVPRQLSDARHIGLSKEGVRVGIETDGEPGGYLIERLARERFSISVLGERESKSLV